MVLRNILPTTPRPKGTDWMFMEGEPIKSASATGVWIANRKIALFVVNNHYNNPPNSTYIYDHSSEIKLQAQLFGLRYAMTNLTKRIFLCGGNSWDTWSSPGTMVYNPDKNE